MDDSSDSPAKNWLAQPVAAGIITAGALALLGSPGLSAMDYAKQAAIGAGAVYVSEMAQAATMGGKSAWMSPAYTAAAFAGISKAAGVNDDVLTLALGGAIVDVASQFGGNAIAGALGL